jgi:TRAP-type C4-dicarboxylate transport system substrate-binding protein
MTPEVFAVARTTWARIAPADQAIVRAAAVESAQMQRKLWAEREVASRAKVAAAGAMIIDNIDKAPWIAAMKPVYERFGSSAQVKPLLDRILAEK